jgi:hypothetical protein
MLAVREGSEYHSSIHNLATYRQYDDEEYKFKHAKVREKRVKNTSSLF